MSNINNFNDPLFLHPSDAPGMTIVSEQLTGVENYGIWSRAMLIALRAKNKTAFIDGTCARPPAGSPTSNQWERCNALILSWIMNSVSKNIFGGIVYSSDASVVWSDLKDQFDKVNGSRIFSIHRELGKLTQGNDTISVYFCRLKQLWDEYSSLVVLPSCECTAARKYVEHDQQHRLLQFLMGLNDSYMHIRTVAHNVTGDIVEPSPKTAARSGSSFTPAQYAEILQLLEGTALISSHTNAAAKPLQGTDTSAANMAGQFHDSAQADWIIDTGANEHMTGNFHCCAGDCVLTSVYLINRTPSPLLNNKTPFEVIFGKTPSYEHLKVFGCLCYAASLHISHKFSPRANPCVFLGYYVLQKGYKVMDLDTKRFFVSRDVVFHESHFPFAAKSRSNPFFPASKSFFDSSPLEDHHLFADLDTSSIPVNNVDEVPSIPVHTTPPIPLRRSSRVAQPPTWTKDFSCPTLPSSSTTHCHYPISNHINYSTFSPSYQSFLTALSFTTEPRSYHEAIADPRWKNAMDLELAALDSNHI
ncbi:uncharacterized protein LOC142504424 [Primulina tabacum]|uniref:uncharacterized protein LOC142504424 n=1 Tax=Primulina tabacum TaxID=48773 RepID=UPI003F5AD74D